MTFVGGMRNTNELILGLSLLLLQKVYFFPKVDFQRKGRIPTYPEKTTKILQNFQTRFELTK